MLQRGSLQERGSFHHVQVMVSLSLRLSLFLRFGPRAGEAIRAVRYKLWEAALGLVSGVRPELSNSEHN